MTGPGQVPQGYPALLAALKHDVRAARTRARRVVNTELLSLYWSIGERILRQQRTEGWGTGVLRRLADDLRSAFPEMRGFSRRNVFYMRAMAETWPDREEVQQVVAQLPWGHVTVLLDQLDNRSARTGTPTRRWSTAGHATSC